MPKECNGQHVITSIGVANESGSQKNNINENMKNLDRGFVVFNGKGIVDGGSFMQDMKNNKFLEEDIKSKCWNHRKKSDVARERWKLLAKALLKPKKNCSKTVRDISVRRFTSFDLVTPNKLGEYPTDYWVSQERKFCEFCKCYVSANKASIVFHENGKNHRENVAKRLKAMQKKAAKEAKEAANYKNELKKIEAAALRAYVKDIELNPDFTSQTIGKITIPDVPAPAKKSLSNSAKYKQNRSIQEKPVKKWMEALSEDGKKYYWNIETRESVWEAPEDDFVSLEEQQSKKASLPKGSPGPSKFKKKFRRKGKQNFNKDKDNSVKPVGEQGEEEEDDGDGDGDDNDDDDDGGEEEVKEKEKPFVFFPILQGHPYGKWETVTAKSEKPIDLQLPQQESVKIVVPNIKEDFDRKFEEKKIPTPGSIVSTSGEIGFKKRKFSSGLKRNIRQRLDND